MKIPGKVAFAAQRLREGHRINRITVRDFLRHFGAERRGAVKVQEIRAILDSLGLETKPDFETAWIDGSVRVCLKDGVQTIQEGVTQVESSGTTGPDSDVEETVLDSTPSAVEIEEEEVVSAPTSSAPEAVKDSTDGESAPINDPTFRIGRLPAANKKLVAVNQDDSLKKL